ncbi:MAG: hypothetical protein ACREV5_10010, partial [Steroidobacter sp.]
MSVSARVCLIGFGEVGQILATDLLARGVDEISVWDIEFRDPASLPSRAARLVRVRVGTNVRDAA